MSGFRGFYGRAGKKGDANCYSVQGVRYLLAPLQLQMKVEGPLAVTAYPALCSARRGRVGNGPSTAQILLSSPPGALSPPSLPVAICSGTGPWQGALGAVLSSQWPRS